MALFSAGNIYPGNKSTGCPYKSGDTIEIKVNPTHDLENEDFTSKRYRFAFNPDKTIDLFDLEPIEISNQIGGSIAPFLYPDKNQIKRLPQLALSTGKKNIYVKASVICRLCKASLREEKS